MHLSLRQIQVFSAVAQHQSYTRAAEVLHMTQPAVSMQIKQLEKDTGLGLFERQGRRMRLTSTGREVQQYCVKVLHSYSDLLGAIESLQNIDQGHLMVSVATTANYFVTRMLADFSQQYPGVNVTLDVTNRAKLLHQLENLEPDLVIMGEPPKGFDLLSEQFMENPLVMIASPQHPLAGKKQLSLQDIANERFVVREKGSGTRDAIERHLMAHGAYCKTSLEMRSNETIKHAVEAGLGLGIVSLHTVQPELQAGRLCLLDIEHFPIKRHWHIVTRKGKRLTPVAKLFHDFVKKEAPRFVSA
ncbi:MAG: LysR family transcriptional regulator [Thiolinea sp.]